MKSFAHRRGRKNKTGKCFSKKSNNLKVNFHLIETLKN